MTELDALLICATPLTAAVRAFQTMPYAITDCSVTAWKLVMLCWIARLELPRAVRTSAPKVLMRVLTVSQTVIATTASFVTVPRPAVQDSASPAPLLGALVPHPSALSLLTRAWNVRLTGIVMMEWRVPGILAWLDFATTFPTTTYAREAHAPSRGASTLPPFMRVRKTRRPRRMPVLPVVMQTAIWIPSRTAAKAARLATHSLAPPDLLLRLPRRPLLRRLLQALLPRLLLRAPVPCAETAMFAARLSSASLAGSRETVPVCNS
jgi:hypothetical protein